jgi:hypothetical protein
VGFLAIDTRPREDKAACYKLIPKLTIAAMEIFSLLNNSRTLC